MSSFYVPATISNLAKADLDSFYAVGVSRSLAAGLNLDIGVAEDVEEADFAAFDLAGQISLFWCGQYREPWRRVILRVNILETEFVWLDSSVGKDKKEDFRGLRQEDLIQEMRDLGIENLPGLAYCRSKVGWDAVESIFVDEAKREIDVRAAFETVDTEDPVFTRLVEEPPLWFDASERNYLLKNWREL